MASSARSDSDANSSVLQEIVRRLSTAWVKPGGNGSRAAGAER
jgi:hypothetical protein